MTGWRLLLCITCLVSLMGCGLAEGVAAFYGLKSASHSPSELDAMLRPHDKWFLPDSPNASSHPGVLLVPGCAGTQPFHEDWAKFLASEGYVSLLIDSFTARGITEPEDLEGACEGEHTWGFERAGDVLVSLGALKAHVNVAVDSLHLIGWSHGGWAVMDAVSLAGSEINPPLLTQLPTHVLRGVRTTVALYPYCDFGTFTEKLGWPTSVRGLLVLAKRDKNIEPEPCYELVKNQSAEGRPLTQRSFDVDHWFDNPEGTEIVPHEYSARTTQEVRGLVSSYIKEEE